MNVAHQRRMWLSSGRSAERSRTSLPSGRRTKPRRRRKRVTSPTRSWPSQWPADKASCRTTPQPLWFQLQRLNVDLFFFSPHRSGGGESRRVSAARQQPGQHVQAQTLLRQGRQRDRHCGKRLRSVAKYRNNRNFHLELVCLYLA